MTEQPRKQQAATTRVAAGFVSLLQASDLRRTCNIGAPNNYLYYFGGSLFSL